MSMFKQYANCFQRAIPMVQSGMFGKPLWYEGARRSPPEIRLQEPKPPTVTFPEDKLYRMVIKKKPMLELEVESPMDFKRSLAHRFASRQQEIIEETKVTQQEAYTLTEEEFGLEITAFEKNLDSIHEDGAKRLSFNTIKSNVSQAARVSGTIAQLVEKRIDQEMGGALWIDPIKSTKDTKFRRQAKLTRLANDPAIAHVKALYRPPKPSVLKALEVLVRDPTSEDTAYWQEELRRFMVSLQYQLRKAPSREQATVPESTELEMGRLKEDLREVYTQTKNSKFSVLTLETQTSVIEIVKTALRLKVVPKDRTPGLRVSTERQNILSRVKDLRAKLDVEESGRSLREIMGKEYYSFVEGSWWKDSDERKKFLAETEVYKATL